MRLIIELWNRYVQMDAGRLDEPAQEPDDEDEAPIEVRLPLGFQPPPATVEECDDDDEEYETPEVDCL